MVVEELLKLFVTEVDAYLFERVKLEYFKARDVEDANEVHFLGSLNCTLEIEGSILSWYITFIV